MKDLLGLELTGPLVDGLSHHLARSFGAVILPKAASPVMAAAGELLGVADLLRAAGLDLGLPSQEAWPRYGTTLGPFVFLPEDLDLHQRALITVHEVTHVAQARAEGWARFATRYLKSREYRAAQEAGAYGAEQEFLHACTGAVPPLDQVVRIDHGYALKAEDMTFGKLLTRQSVTACARGLYTQPVALAAIAYLRTAA